MEPVVVRCRFHVALGRGNSRKKTQHSATTRHAPLSFMPPSASLRKFPMTTLEYNLKFSKKRLEMAKDLKTCLKWRQRHRFRVNQKYKLQKLHKYTDQWPLTMTRDLPRIVTCRPHHNAWLWHITASVWIKLDAMVVTAAEIHGLSRWRCSLLAASPRKILIFCGNGCSSTPSDPNQNTEPNWDCTRSLHHHMNLSGKPPRRGSCARGRCQTWVLEVGVLGADKAPSFVQPWRYGVLSRLKAGWKDNMLKTSETMETWCQMAARSTPKWFQDVRTLPNCHQVALRGSNSKNRWVPWTNPHFPPWPWLITATGATLVVTWCNQATRWANSMASMSKTFSLETSPWTSRQLHTQRFKQNSTLNLKSFEYLRRFWRLLLWRRGWVNMGTSKPCLTATAEMPHLLLCRRTRCPPWAGYMQIMR